ncbi:MAG: hypothetical protein MUE60_16315 [Candidatus Eisenbacteria bacterium]|nr:hypothetical protein [Candidatus Eisenbacteria bacterium]
MVVRTHGREAVGDYLEASGFGNDPDVLRNLRPVDNLRQQMERRIIQTLCLHEGLEAALVLAMRVVDARAIERLAALPPDDFQSLVLPNTLKLRLRIDTLPGEPRTRHAVRLSPLSRHPFHGPPPVPCDPKESPVQEAREW